MRSEPVAPSSSISAVRQVGLGEDPVADRVVDVVVDVRDAIDDAHDLALERLRLLRARVREDAVADLVREVEPSRDPQRLLVVAEPPPERRVERVVERLLARVPERRVAGVVAETDRLDEILVEAERPRDDARDRGRLERVRHPGAVVVAVRVDEDLRLALQPAGTASSGRGGRGRAGTACGPQHGSSGTRRPRVSNERTASGDSHASLLSADPLLERLNGAACEIPRMEGSRDSDSVPYAAYGRVGRRRLERARLAAVDGDARPDDPRCAR